MPIPTNLKQIGANYEKLVANYFLKLKHIILAQNFKTSSGEIDLITFYNSTIYFFEIKFTNKSTSNPYFKWSKKQKFRMIKAINIFLLKNPKLQKYNYALQFIWLNQISSSKIKLYKFQNIELNYD